MLFIDFRMTSQLNAHISYLYYITLFAESFGSFSVSSLRSSYPPVSSYPFTLHPPILPPSNRLDNVWTKKMRIDKEPKTLKAEEFQFHIYFVFICSSHIRFTIRKWENENTRENIYMTTTEKENLNTKKIIHVMLFVFTSSSSFYSLLFPFDNTTVI